MEQVKKQTVEELIAAKLSYLAIANTVGKPLYSRLNREFKRELQHAGCKVTEIALVLGRQCNHRVEFFEFEYIVDIIYKDGREIENHLEIFYKMLALLGVEVVE